MKKIIFLSLFFILLISPLFSDIISDNDKEIKKISIEVLNNVLNGIKNNDYSIFSKNFDQNLIELITKDKFNIFKDDFIKKYGNIKEIIYLGFINKEKFTIVLWKCKNDKNNIDLMVKLHCSKRDKNIVLSGLWFK